MNYPVRVSSFTDTILSLIHISLNFGLDIRVYGWYAGLVAIFAIVFGINSIVIGDIGTAYLWLAWSLLWGWGDVYKRQA